MANQTSTWGSEDLTLLRTMWCAGNSASVISDALHRSRNAILGKVNRMKLHRESDQPTVIKTRTSTTPTRPKAPTKGTLAAPVESKPARPVAYLEAKSFHCHAVFDERGDDGLVMRCGARHLPGLPWCREHYLVYHASSRSP